jgi:hypothetical protein
VTVPKVEGLSIVEGLTYVAETQIEAQLILIERSAIFDHKPTIGMIEMAHRLGLIGYDYRMEKLQRLDQIVAKRTEQPKPERRVMMQGAVSRRINRDCMLCAGTGVYQGKICPERNCKDGRP